MKYHHQLESYLFPTPPAFINCGLVFVKTYDNQSDIGGKIKGFIFTNEDSNVSISISVSEICSMTTFIFKDQTVYELQEYLNFKKRKEEYGSNFFSVSVEKYVDNLSQLIVNELGDIITGKRWEEIPRDWMGFK